MAEKTKQQWVAPAVRRYGSFETATQGCDKNFGGSDGFTFMGAAISCTAS